MQKEECGKDGGLLLLGQRGVSVFGSDTALIGSAPVQHRAVVKAIRL